MEGLSKPDAIKAVALLFVLFAQTALPHSSFAQQKGTPKELHLSYEILKVRTTNIKCRLDTKIYLIGGHALIETKGNGLCHNFQDNSAFSSSKTGLEVPLGRTEREKISCTKVTKTNYSCTGGRTMSDSFFAVGAKITFDRETSGSLSRSRLSINHSELMNITGVYSNRRNKRKRLLSMQISLSKGGCKLKKYIRDQELVMKDDISGTNTDRERYKLLSQSCRIAK